MRNHPRVEEEKDTRLKRPDTTTLTPRGGFLEREEPSTVALAEQFFWIARMKFTPETRPQALSYMLLHAEYVHEQEKEALSFLVAEDAHDESCVVIFERFTDEKAFRDFYASNESGENFREEVSVFLSTSTSWLTSGKAQVSACG
jgi:quinol monooxygenase YgiN